MSWIVGPFAALGVSIAVALISGGRVPTPILGASVVGASVLAPSMIGASILGESAAPSAEPAFEPASESAPESLTPLERDLAVSVVVQSETLTPLAGVAVRVGGPNCEWGSTDSTGVASEVACVRSQPFEVEIRSAEVKGGVLLAQRLTLRAGDETWAAEAAQPNFVAHLTLPVAWDIALPSSEPRYAKPWHDRWIVWPQEDWIGPPACLRLAHLSTPETLNGYLRACSGEAINAMFALLLCADAQLPLPPSGLALSIDTLGHEAERELAISTLQVVDSPSNATPSMRVELAARRGRYRDVVLHGTLQRGANLLVFSRRARPDRVTPARSEALAAWGTPGATNPPRSHPNATGHRTLASRSSEPSERSSAPEPTSPPLLRPIAVWALPEIHSGELKDALDLSSAAPTGVEEHQLTFAMPGSSAGAVPANRPWAVRVQWIGAPALHLESGSWSRWESDGPCVETWTGSLETSDFELDPEELALWFYRRQKRRITTWTVEDAANNSAAAVTPRREVTLLAAPRQVCSVCVQTSGACATFVQR